MITMPALSVRQGSVLARLYAVVAVVVPRIGSGLRSLASRARQPVLYLGAGGSVCYAGWQVAQPLGWLLIGGCLLLLEGLTSAKPTDPDGQR